MWRHDFHDYPLDTHLKEQGVESGKGIVGCEMHDVNGWNEQWLQETKPARGILRLICESLFGLRGKSSNTE